MRIKSVAYAVFALCLFGGGGCSQSDDKLIVPGERVGPYRLHQPRSTIHGGDLNAYTHPAAKGLLLSFEDEHASVISVFSPDYQTDGGLKLGSATNEVVACYGQPDEITNGIMVYQILGIEFLCSDDTVRLINVLDKNDFNVTSPARRDSLAALSAHQKFQWREIKYQLRRPHTAW